MGFDLTAVQVLILTWVLVSLWLGVRVPATLLLLPKKKVEGDADPELTYTVSRATGEAVAQAVEDTAAVGSA